MISVMGGYSPPIRKRDPGTSPTQQSPWRDAVARDASGHSAAVASTERGRSNRRTHLPWPCSMRVNLQYCDLYDGSTGRMVCWLNGHIDTIRSLAFFRDRDRRWLVSACDDQAVCIWNLGASRKHAKTGCSTGVYANWKDQEYKVEQVDPASPNVRSGILAKGDIIEGIERDGAVHSFQGPDDLWEAIRGAPLGIPVKLIGFDLRLMSSVNDVNVIPTEGKNLIIVAAVNNVLHFRIFDGDGKEVVDTDENRLKEEKPQIGQQIEELRSDSRTCGLPTSLLATTRSGSSPLLHQSSVTPSSSAAGMENRKL